MNPGSYLSLNFPSALLVLGAWAGVFTLIRLLRNEGGHQVPGRILAAILFGMTMVVMAPLMLFALDRPFDRVLFRAMGMFSFLYGPLVYFYILGSVQKDFALRRRQFWHGLPTLLLLVAILVVTWLGGENTREPLITQGARPPLAAKIMAMVLLTHVATYLWLAARTLRSHARFVKQAASYSDHLHSRWLWFVFSLLLLPIASILFSLLFFAPLSDPPYAILGTATMLLCFQLLWMFVPEVFTGFPEPLLADKEEDLELPRYAGSPLDQEQKQRYFDRLLAFMDQEKPFLRPDLTLAEVAEALHTNPRYLSQVINELGERNFMDFINQHRVEAAKEILTSSAYRHITIHAIAQEVGFHSRSAFYASFKKIAGQTPSEFRQANEESSLS